MKTTILPVTYPTITTFPPYADALAILMSHKESLDWVYSHYIQTYIVEVIEGSENNLRPIMPCFFGDFDSRRIVNTVSDCIFLNREINPFLNIFEVPNDIIETIEGEYVSFIKKALDSSMYVYAYCDISKIKDYNRQECAAHEVFIFGYDDSKNLFHYADFPNNRSYKYKFSTCTYDEIEAAFRAVKELFVPVVKSVALIQFEGRGPFTFDYSYIQDSIYDYLYPNKEMVRRLGMYIDSFVNFGEFNWKTKIYVGVDTYDYFASIKDRIITTEDISRIDLRLYNAMYEHKMMMIERIQHLVENGYMSKEKNSLFNRIQNNSQRYAQN